MGKSESFEFKRKMGARVNYMRNKSWNTRSNKVRQVRTPGGRLVAHYVAKKCNIVKSAINTTYARMDGLKSMRPTNYARTHKTTRRVSRAYGGHFTHRDLKNRIIRTFLIEEVKQVKRTVQMAAADSKKNKKSKGKAGQKKRVAPKKINKDLAKSDNYLNLKNYKKL